MELPALGVTGVVQQGSIVALEAPVVGAECRVVLEHGRGRRISVEMARLDAAWLEVVCRLLLTVGEDSSTPVQSLPGAVRAVAAQP